MKWNILPEGQIMGVAVVARLYGSADEKKAISDTPKPKLLRCWSDECPGQARRLEP